MSKLLSTKAWKEEVVCAHVNFMGIDISNPFRPGAGRSRDLVTEFSLLQLVKLLHEESFEHIVANMTDDSTGVMEVLVENEFNFISIDRHGFSFPSL